MLTSKIHCQRQKIHALRQGAEKRTIYAEITTVNYVYSWVQTITTLTKLKKSLSNIHVHVPTIVKQKAFQSLTHMLSSLIECTSCLPTLTFYGNCWKVFLHLVFPSNLAHFMCRMWNVHVLITRHFQQNKFPGPSTKVCWILKWRV